MISRVFNADYINAVANHPCVSVGAKIISPIDLMSVAEDYGNVILIFDGGAFILLGKGGGIYEVHTMALKEGRGKILRGAVNEALEYMFFKTDCIRLVTISYKDNVAACALASAYFDKRGENDEYNYYDLTYSQWIASCKTAQSAGEEFHKNIETNHDTDCSHDCNVGGALLLIKNGNVMKAISVYNQWAIMSGYEQAILTNQYPPIAHIGEMKLIYHNNRVDEICQ